MKKCHNIKAIISLTILLTCALTSCKRDRTCTCQFQGMTGQPQIFHDTKKDAEEKCVDKCCGGECDVASIGYTLK
jgi:hypothetical protein